MARIPPRVLLTTGGIGWALLAAIVLPAGMGAAFLLGGPARTASPSFDVARSLTGRLPWLDAMAWWGMLMLCGAAFLSAGVARGDIEWLRRGLVVGAGFWAFWAAQFTIAALAHPSASMGAPWIYLAVTLSHIALAQGVAKAPGR